MCLLDMKFNFITILIAESVFYLKKKDSNQWYLV